MRITKNSKYESVLKRECLDEAQSIEEMVRQAVANNEPIEATAPMIYTEDAKGVMPEYDIRTDRQEVALDATDKYSKSERAKRENKPTDELTEPNNPEGEQ